MVTQAPTAAHVAAGIVCAVGNPLGRPDILTAITRRTLIRLRDQALASERIVADGNLYQAGWAPS